jgi:hypothetical protein
MYQLPQDPKVLLPRPAACWWWLPQHEEWNSSAKDKRGGNMLSFKWLKDQKMLRQGSTTRCVKQDAVFPEFRETAASGESMQHFSEDGVFISGSVFFRPGAYCVDGELDTEREEVEQQPSHVKVIVCGERAESMGRCGEDVPNCYDR